MKYYLIVGEASGDLHASHLMKELKARDAEAGFPIFGGDLMKAQGRDFWFGIIKNWPIWGLFPCCSICVRYCTT